MRSFVLAVALLAGASSCAFAEEANYRCRDFVQDFIKVPASEKVKPRANPFLAQSAGFLMGAFYAKTGLDFTSEDTSALADFENMVVAECSAHPDARVPVTILKVIKNVEPPKGKALATDDDSYAVTSLTDLKLDAKELAGKRVEVTGFLQSMGALSMISESPMDMNKLFVETDKLSRDDRKYIIESCGMGCNVTIRGKASNSAFGSGMVAESLVHD